MLTSLHLVDGCSQSRLVGTLWPRRLQRLLPGGFKSGLPASVADGKTEARRGSHLPCDLPRACGVTVPRSGRRAFTLLPAAPLCFAASVSSSAR